MKAMILSGYLGKSKRRRSSGRRRQSSGLKRQQNKMKACAVEWKKHDSGSYRSFMKHCLSR